MYIQTTPTIEHRTSLLAFNANACGFELQGNGALVNDLEQSRPKLSVNFDATSDNTMNQCLEIVVQP
jgi:hypothetical protein